MASGGTAWEIGRGYAGIHSRPGSGSGTPVARADGNIQGIPSAFLLHGSADDFPEAARSFESREPQIRNLSRRRPAIPETGFRAGRDGCRQCDGVSGNSSAEKQTVAGEALSSRRDSV